MLKGSGKPHTYHSNPVAVHSTLLNSSEPWMTAVTVKLVLTQKRAYTLPQTQYKWESYYWHTADRMNPIQGIFWKTGRCHALVSAL